jgi:low affinity Fe/Cu permease
MSVVRVFTRIANAVARATGRPTTFVICLLLVFVWGVTGPLFRFSDTWQLVINTGTTIITFLMVFLIQNTQNRESAAVQAKLDELLRAMKGADNRYIGIEHLTDRELEEVVEETERRVGPAATTKPGRGRPASDFAEPAGSANGRRRTKRK